jgi:hypothetical protein
MKPKRRRRRWILVIAGVVTLLIAAAGVWYVRTRAAFTKIEILDPGPSGERIDEDGVFANYFPSEGKRRAPGVLLLGGSEGGIGAGVNDAARSLQDEGYSVLVPSYFGAPGQPKHLELIGLETFDRALAWLRARPEVDPDRLVIGGVSKGAEAALLVATRRPELRAVVAGVPSSVVWPGIKFGTLRTDSSWTLDGRPLPTLPYGPFRFRMLLGDIGVVYREGMTKLSSHADAEIPIEKIKAPVLLICGEDDTLWPSCQMSRQLKARAEKHDGPPVKLLAYPDAGHLGVGAPLEEGDPLLANLDFLGGTKDGNNAARADGWPKILGFVRRVLEDAGDAQ